ncbi:MAG: hypothetical protein M0R74_11350 [Dehalococcoidia bacterium]|jgi:hypothetical protein|nr:hypothetical protein [Dehalococcoidia bacterium]
MTPLDIIKNARNLLNLDGIGMPVAAEEANVAFSFLNMILSNWNTQGLICYYLITETFSITTGTSTYLIGSGQAFDSDRPVKLTAVQIRDSSRNDHPCLIIENQQYWAGIYDKFEYGDMPEYVLYTPKYPYGEFIFYPVPNQNLTVVVTQQKQLAVFAEMTEVVSLPPGYEIALVYNLAVKIAPQYGVSLNTGDAIYDEAIRLLSDLKRVNMRPTYLQQDQVIMSGGHYNINKG